MKQATILMTFLLKTTFKSSGKTNGAYSLNWASQAKQTSCDKPQKFLE
jgi:hypothetical protein